MLRVLFSLDIMAGDKCMSNIYTVKQVNSYVKNMFAQDFMLNRIYVKGEVSNCKYHSSGHIYFSLKDESGIMACVMFARTKSGLSFVLKDGQEVVVLGSISFYERDGRVQLYAKEITLDGVGHLYEKFESLKKELSEMGMFAPEYKLPIPPFVKTVGVVTSETGAVIQDIIQVAKRRNPYVQIILYPAKVQGEGAKESIVKGIELLENIGVDLMIVGRGGGSIEDLWAFNEEEVARAVFNCRIPIISAVGHETDTTIIDFVADMRAPTPSAATEMAIYEHFAVKNHILQCEIRLRKSIVNHIGRWRKELEQLALMLKVGHPKQKLNEKNQRLVELEKSLKNHMTKKISENKQALSILIERLKGLSPLEKLNQGYSYMTGKKGENLKSITQVNIGDEIEVTVTDGRIKAKVKEVTDYGF